MKRMLVAGAAVFLLTACAGGREYRAPPPVAPPQPEYLPQSRVQPPPPQAPAKPAPQAEPRRVPENVPSAGPLKTAMVGSYMDNQERDLRQHLRGTGVKVSRPGDEIVLTVPNDALFEGSTNRLTVSGMNALATIAVIARHYDHTQISVGGFTDTTGSPEQNTAASQKRARAVADRLIADGVDADRITSQGFGETHLRIKTGDSVKEPRNRRIEIRLTAAVTG